MKPIVEQVVPQTVLAMKAPSVLPQAVAGFIWWAHLSLSPKREVSPSEQAGNSFHNELPYPLSLSLGFFPCALHAGRSRMMKNTKIKIKIKNRIEYGRQKCNRCNYSSLFLSRGLLLFRFPFFCSTPLHFYQTFWEQGGRVYFFCFPWVWLFPPLDSDYVVNRVLPAVARRTQWRTRKGKHAKKSVSCMRKASLAFLHPPQVIWHTTVQTYLSKYSKKLRGKNKFGVFLLEQLFPLELVFY